MNRTEKHACNYGVLRFLPYPETGEFVNLGIVAHCPALDWFGARIETRKISRVTDFFPELDRNAFRQARTAIENEVSRIGSMIAEGFNPEQGRLLFRELVRPREAIFRFMEVRTILTVEPEATVDRLFAQYVHRHFAQPREFQEQIMARRFMDALRKFRPDRIFREQIVGTATYHVRIPICSDLRSPAGVPRRAIKPLDLDRPEPTNVIEHGDAWIQRVRRLREVDQLPERLIFAVRQPQTGACVEAAHRVVDELTAVGAIAAPEQETNEILLLAAN